MQNNLPGNLYASIRQFQNALTAHFWTSYNKYTLTGTKENEFHYINMNLNINLRLIFKTHKTLILFC